MAHNDFTTVQIGALLDYLCAAVDAARVAAKSNQRWSNAINSAWGFLLEQDSVLYRSADHALLVTSASEPGKTYRANGRCQCNAYATNQACWHRAAARLVRRAIELRDQAEQNALAAELVQEAHEVGCTWYGVREGLEGARARMPEVMSFAEDWDAQCAALGARIARAAMNSPLAA